MSNKLIPIERLEEALRKIKVEKAAEPDFYIYYLMASVICGYYLGNEWVMDRHQHDKSLIPTGTNGESELIMVEIAHYLYGLKHISGFNLMIDKFKEQDALSVHFELFVAWNYFECGNIVEITLPQRAITRDFDFRVTSQCRVVYNVECKNRSDPYNKAKSVDNAMKKARKQLPKDGNGMIHIAVSHDMYKMSNGYLSLKESIQNFLANTSRVKAVVIHHKVWNHFDNGKYLVFYAHEIFSNHKVEAQVPYDEGTFRKFSPSFLTNL
jgi:hypothetical protein